MSDELPLSRAPVPERESELDRLDEQSRDGLATIIIGRDHLDNETVMRGLRKLLACGLQAQTLANRLERELYERSGD